MDDGLPPLLRGLLAAVGDHPDDVALRLHTAELLLEHRHPAAAAAQASAVLERDPRNGEARRLLVRAAGLLAEEGSPAARPETGGPDRTRASQDPRQAEAVSDGHGSPPGGFDWRAAEEEVHGIVEPAFVDGTDGRAADGETDPDVKRSEIRLADVGGMEEVKRRLDMTFLTPMRNPELRRLYGRSLPGGLLLYGPPGCGKTFLAKAVAGELGANFYAVSLADVLDMYTGASERNMRAVFETARRNAPCLLFLDEVDALGQKREHLRNSAGMRGAVNQLLTEMDSVKSNNDGVFVLGATNHPWDVDTALLRPGRFDRMLLVVPPDPPPGRRSSVTTCATGRWRGSTSASWSASPSTSPARTWRTCVTQPPSTPWTSRCGPARRGRSGWAIWTARCARCGRRRERGSRTHATW
jgi:hypothetical protein